MSSGGNDIWLGFAPRRPLARLRLLCFPFAGGGAAVYRTWAAGLPEEIEVCPVQLPGREARLREAPYRRLHALADTLAEVLEPHTRRPFAIFGHSLGAWIGYEVAQRLRQHDGRQPTHLLVSARRAPQLPARLTPIHRLPDADFLTALQARYGGIPAAVLAEPELLELFLPLLRADLEMVETYVPADDEPLDCPISAFGGLVDPTVSQAELAGWREQTLAAFRLDLLPGDHFYLQPGRAALLRAIGERLTPVGSALVG